MSINIHANTPIAVTALQTIPFTSIGLSGENILIIHRISSVPASWMPSRAFNSFNGFVEGQGYVIYPLVDMDLSAFVAPPIPSDVQDVQNWTLSNFSQLNHTHIISDVTGLQSALNSKEGLITAGGASQYWRGDKTWQTLDKAAIGLINVDNTSDASKNAAIATLTNKTISGATNTFSNIPQSAITGLTTSLASKQDVLVSGTSIKTINGQTLLGSGDIVISASGTPTLDNVLSAGNLSTSGIVVGGFSLNYVDEEKIKLTIHASGGGWSGKINLRSGGTNYFASIVPSTLNLTASRLLQLPDADGTLATQEWVAAQGYGSGGGAAYTAGAGINISNGVISVTSIIDGSPIQGSTNAVSSDGVYSALQNKADAVSGVFQTLTFGATTVWTYDRFNPCAAVIANGATTINLNGTANGDSGILKVVRVNTNDTVTLPGIVKGSLNVSSEPQFISFINDNGTIYWFTETVSGNGGSGTTYTAGTGINITNGVISTTVLNNWTVSGTTIYNNNSGNVLIGGTSDSGEKLQVTGSAKISGLAGTGTRMVVADAAGSLSTQAIPTGSTGTPTLDAVLTSGNTSTQNLYLSPTGSTSASPRTFGFSPSMTTGQAARLAFGDNFNVMQVGFGSALQIASYNEIVINGSTQNSGSAPAFVTANGTINTRIINVADKIGLTIEGRSAGQTQDLQRWYTKSSDTIPIAKLSSIGDFTALNIISSALTGSGSRLIIANTNGQLASITNSTDGTVLTLVGGVPTWAAASGGTGGVTYTAGTGISITNGVISSTVISNWTVSGTNIYNSNTGNVLIGTTTDNGSKLQVNGNVYIGGVGTMSSMVVANADTTATYLRFSNTTTGGKSFDIYTSGSGNFDGAGNFGIYNNTNDRAVFLYRGSNKSISFDSTSVIGWGSNAYASAIQVGFGRNAAGVAEVNNGTLGTFADLKLKNLTTAGDIEVTDVTKGVIMKDANGIRWRYQPDIDGRLTATQL